MLIFLFLLGLGVGGVINILADNLPPDAVGVRRGFTRPQCIHCRTNYPPAHWWSLAHWVLNRGKCAQCGARRSLRHTLVEFVTGLAVAYAWDWALGDWLNFSLAAVTLFIFILIAVIDIEHLLILRSVIGPAAVAAVIIGLLRHGFGETLVGGAAGYAILFGLYLFGQLFGTVMARMRGQPLDEVVFGGGDVNLGLVIGLLVGWRLLPLALLITVLAGAAFSLLYIIVQLLRGRYNLYMPIPYGPFLILGGFVMYFYDVRFLNAFCGVMQWSCYRP